MLRNINQYTYLINRNLYTQKQVVFLKCLKMSIKTLIKCFEWHHSHGDRSIDSNCVHHRNGPNNKQEYVKEIKEKNQEVVTGVT